MTSGMYLARYSKGVRIKRFISTNIRPSPMRVLHAPVQGGGHGGDAGLEHGEAHGDLVSRWAIGQAPVTQASKH